MSTPNMIGYMWKGCGRRASSWWKILSEGFRNEKVESGSFWRQIFDHQGFLLVERHRLFVRWDEDILLLENAMSTFVEKITLSCLNRWHIWLMAAERRTEVAWLYLEEVKGGRLSGLLHSWGSTWFNITLHVPGACYVIILRSTQRLPRAQHESTHAINLRPDMCRKRLGNTVFNWTRAQFCGTMEVGVMKYTIKHLMARIFSM